MSMVKVVLVDDHSIVIEGIKRIIVSDKNYAVVAQLSNGREAIEYITHHEADIIIMDVNMPEMDGFTTTRFIRQLPEPHCAIPVIALTADAMAGDREKCIAAGMNDYVTKPFRIEEIEAVLKNRTLLV